jgi:hypothetical protein
MQLTANQCHKVILQQATLAQWYCMDVSHSSQQQHRHAGKQWQRSLHTAAESAIAALP